MGNPNEYDDAAFVAASNDLQLRLPMLLDGLWDAGAEPKDIVNELTNALDGWDPVLDAGVAGTVIVSLGEWA